MHGISKRPPESTDISRRRLEFSRQKFLEIRMFLHCENKKFLHCENKTKGDIFDEKDISQQFCKKLRIQQWFKSIFLKIMLLFYPQFLKKSLQFAHFFTAQCLGLRFWDLLNFICLVFNPQYWYLLLRKKMRWFSSYF